jgi:hypothetical protein
MKLTKDTTPQSKARRVLLPLLPIFGACTLATMLVSCASVDKNDSSVDETSRALSESPAVEEQSEPVQQFAGNESTEEAADVDAMMARLAAPSKNTVTVPVQDDANSEAKIAEQKRLAAKKLALEKAKAKKAELARLAAEKLAAEQAKAEAARLAIEKEKAAAADAAKAQMAKLAATVKKQKGPVKALSITKKDLPASYDIWTLKQGETPLTKGLVIMTPTWEMGKEGYMSQVWLTLTEDEIHINSSSDIAPEARNLGIKIDGGSLIPFSRIAENNIGVVKGQWLDKLANAKKLQLYLGFFPGKKPTSKTFVTETSLQNLDRMVLTYRKLK